MSKFSKPILFYLLLTCNQAYSYETPVHAKMGMVAFSRSNIIFEENAFLIKYGFDRIDLKHPFQTEAEAFCGSTISDPTSTAYLDAKGDWLETALPPDSSKVKFRCPRVYERRSMPLDYSGRVQSTLGSAPHLRLEAWLMRGLIREDDYEGAENDGFFPDPNPWDADNAPRPVNHFYSAVTNSPDSAQVTTVLDGISALRWALGEEDPFLSGSIPEVARANHFSFLDARRNMFLALTYKIPASGNNEELAAYKTRAVLWASTFKALGHVMHLLQDQASPQHARGEPHNHVCNGYAAFVNQDLATRTYENYSNYRMLYPDNQALAAANLPPMTATNNCEEQQWLDMFATAGAKPPPNANGWYSVPYPIPMFRVQRMFFTTRNPSDSIDPTTLPVATINARAGLGDYSNRGFFTQDYQAGHYKSPPAITDPSFVQGNVETLQIPGIGQVKVRALYWQVPDSVIPNYPDPGLVNDRAPIASASIWSELGIPSESVLSLRNYDQMADMLIPRAVAYSAGLINFFFRGELEIIPLDQRVFGVMNQSNPHTVDSNGYPRKANGDIFGFEKIRLKVRNTTKVITESGSNATVPQIVGSGKLVAVARYHRNACYKPDLSGERVQNYALPPAVVIGEPSCAGLATRTEFQDISVSAPITINGEGDLPGGTEMVPAALEKEFDFSADPIPVNATDLFIQVVYRGQLGAETDGIAVGNYDVREPTFYSAWNNTDYYFNTTTNAWQSAGGSFPARVINGLQICAGVPSKLVYRYAPTLPQPGFGFSLGAAGPGTLRLAMLFAQPTGAQQFAVRSTPVMITPPSANQRSTFGRGTLRQASQEYFFAPDALPAPSNCQLNPPVAGSTYWCMDPVQKRRNQRLGHQIQPMYFTNGVLSSDGPDVDADPAQVAFPELRLRTDGEVRFDLSGPLQDCPLPTQLDGNEDILQLREQAWDIGADPRY